MVVEAIGAGAGGRVALSRCRPVGSLRLQLRLMLRSSVGLSKVVGVADCVGQGDVQVRDAVGTGWSVKSTGVCRRQRRSRGGESGGSSSCVAWTTGTAQSLRVRKRSKRKEITRRFESSWKGAGSATRCDAMHTHSNCSRHAILNSALVTLKLKLRLRDLRHRLRLTLTASQADLCLTCPSKFAHKLPSHLAC